jgi:hypothetical protein
LQSDVRLEWNDDADDEDADDPAVRGSSTSMFMGMQSKSASFPPRLSCGGTCRVCIGWFFTARQEKSSNYPTCGIRAHACKKILCRWSNVEKMQGHGSLAGEKNESPNFREPRALERVSRHGKLEYALSSVFDFGPASVRGRSRATPLRPFWEKF